MRGEDLESELPLVAWAVGATLDHADVRQVSKQRRADSRPRRSAGVSEDDFLKGVLQHFGS